MAAGANTDRMDLLLDIVREQGEQRKGILVLEGSVKQATIAVQEATKEIQFYRGSQPTADDCDKKHEEVADKVITKLEPLIKANGNGAGAMKRAFLPRSFLEWCAAVAVVGAAVWGLIEAGAWLSGRDLMPGHETGITIEARPEDPLLIEIRKLNEQLSSGAFGPTSATNEPTWEMMGFGDATRTAVNSE